MTDARIVATADGRSIATLRGLSLDQVQAARSGHLGLPLGAAPILHTLFTRFLVSDPKDPGWINRDRFILSAGHGSALLYATLHLAGYAVTLDDLRAFRQWASITPGHPEWGRTPGVEASTGPLGQGLANAVGMAIAETMAAARLDAPGGPIIDHRTFVLASDGDLMEGVALEAAALAGHLRLGKLIVLYDDNGVVIDSPAAATHQADAVCGALAAYGWDVSGPIDGEDVEAIAAATQRAIDNREQPSLVRVRTTIGYGSSLSGTPKVHGGALDEVDVARIKSLLGPDFDVPFSVPPDVRREWAAFGARGAKTRADWEERLRRLEVECPAAVDGLARLRAEDAVDETTLRVLVPVLDEPEPARFTNGRVLAVLARQMPGLVGGAADLAVATLAYLEGAGDYGVENRAGRNIRFGVREHAMGAIVNGIALHGIFRPFASTFLVFLSYQANALRMAALQGLPVIHLYSHDSITVGEDGPTHQPVEMLATLRATPNTLVLRPADADETLSCFTLALNNRRGPSALILSRMPLPRLDRSAQVGSAARGGYLIRPVPVGQSPAVLIAASGSEVSLAVAASEILAGRGIAASVVSLPSQQLFLEQDATYQNAILPPGVPRLIVEAGHPQPLWQLAGPNGAVYGVERFGASAPPEVLRREYGFTPERIADAAARLVEHGAVAAAPAASASRG